MFALPMCLAASQAELLSGGLCLGAMVFALIIALRHTGARSAVELSSVRDEAAAKLLAAVSLEDGGAQAEAAFRADDPAFTTAALLEKVKGVARRLGGPAADAHPVVSDGLFQRMLTQARLGGLPRELAAFAMLPLQSAQVSGSAVGLHYQRVTVRVHLGEGEQQQTVALTFFRRRGARTAGGAAESKCPHCGAPLELSATQRCRFCEAIVNSGAHDWVLCGVAPAAQQLSRANEELDPDGLRAADPHLAPEELVDRASLAFWRWVEARRTGEVARLRRLASPELLELLSLHAAPAFEVALQGAELRLLRVGEAFDEAHVLARWSDVDEAVTTRSHQSVLVLRRPHGLRTPPEPGLSTFRCQRCFAPVGDAETPACEACGASFHDAWCLHSIEPFSTWAPAVAGVRQQLAGDWARVANAAQRELALRLLGASALLDGEVSSSERDYLEQVARRWELPAGLVDAALAADGPKVLPDFPQDLAEALTRELAEVAFLGGSISPAQRRRLEAMAGQLGTTVALTRALTDLVRRQRESSR